MGNINMLKKTLLLSLTGLILASCNLTGKPDTRVNDYAQKRWDALIAGNLQTAYQYYSDTYKETVPYEHFSRTVKGVGLWSKAKVQHVSCNKQATRCDAEIKVTVAMPMRGLDKPLETSNIIKETWQKNGFFSDWQYASK